ncbi:MAG: molybdopterin-dependent oxidoreductase [Phyllobacterium sp.]
MKTALGGLAITLALSQSGFAQEPLPAAKGEIILRITGDITNENAPDAAAFDREMLERVGTLTVTTSTAWTDGKHEFTGVLVREVLERVGADKKTAARASALNDYSIEIPIADFQKYDVILAWRMDGKDLTARDKGPLWIVYPRDHFRELQDERNDQRWVWQLNRLNIK